MTMAEVQVFEGSGRLPPEWAELIKENKGLKKTVVQQRSTIEMLTEQRDIAEAKLSDIQKTLNQVSPDSYVAPPTNPLDDEMIVRGKRSEEEVEEPQENPEEDNDIPF